MVLMLSLPLAALSGQLPVRTSDSTSTDSVRAALIAPPLPRLAPDSQPAAVARGPIHVSRFVEVGAVAGLAAGLVEGIALVHSCDGCTTYGLYTKAWIPLAAFGGALDGTIISTVAYGGYRLVRHVRHRYSA